MVYAILSKYCVHFFCGKQIKLYNTNIHEKIEIIYGIAIVKEM